MSSNLAGAADTLEIRKARGAFFTPEGITRHLAEWGISSANDRALESSAGEAAFLNAPVVRLRDLGADTPHVYGDSETFLG